MFALILGVLKGFLSGPLSSISKDIRDVQIAKQKAQTDTQKLELDEKLARLEAQRSVIIASQPDLLWRICRAGIALPVVVYLNKIIVYDKVLGWGSTDNLSPDLWNLVYIVIGGFFLEVGAKQFRRT